MNKKILGFCILMLLIVPVFSATKIKSFDNNQIEYLGDPGLVIDQKHEDGNRYGIPVYKEESLVAQGFVPTLKTHSKIELKMFTMYNPDYYVLKLSIRESLDGDDIATSTLSGSEVGNFEMGWVSFLFEENFELTPSKKYFMILEGYNFGDDMKDGIICWMINTSKEDSYLNGSAWGFNGDDWSMFYLYGMSGNPHDFCFRTYCLNLPPEPPSISGPTSGKAGNEYNFTITTIDGDNHDVMYYIDWGDGQTEWTTASPSGQPVQVSHTWDEKDSYTIKVKAKDVKYEAESDWGTFEISMPKNHVFNPFIWSFEQLIQRFPFLEPYLEIVLN